MRDYKVIVMLFCALACCGCVRQGRHASAESPMNESTLEYTAASTSSTTTPPNASINNGASLEDSTKIDTAESSATTYPVSRPRLSADIRLQKNVFHSGEEINIEVLVESPEKVGDVGVRIYGIYANGYRLNQNAAVNLEPGVNVIQFTYTAPRCNACAGIAAGKYTIKAEILYDDQVQATAIEDVNLMQ